MAKKDIKFTLDTIDSRYSPVGTVKQLDSVFFYIKITENGVTKDLTGQTIKLFAIKEDKKIVEQTTKINITNQSEGLVEIELLNAAIQVHGFTYFELEISDSNGIISTADFILRVNKRVGSPEAIESTNEVSTLKEIEVYVAQAKQEIKEFKKLQDKMLKTNETINANEIARVNAENIRSQAEELRIESDKKRDEKIAGLSSKVSTIQDELNDAVKVINEMQYHNECKKFVTGSTGGEKVKENIIMHNPGEYIDINLEYSEDGSRIAQFVPMEYKIKDIEYVRITAYSEVDRAFVSIGTQFFWGSMVTKEIPKGQEVTEVLYPKDIPGLNAGVFTEESVFYIGFGTRSGLITKGKIKIEYVLNSNIDVIARRALFSKDSEHAKHSDSSDNSIMSYGTETAGIYTFIDDSITKMLPDFEVTPKGHGVFELENLATVGRTFWGAFYLKIDYDNIEDLDSEFTLNYNKISGASCTVLKIVDKVGDWNPLNNPVSLPVSLLNEPSINLCRIIRGAGDERFNAYKKVNTLYLLIGIETDNSEDKTSTVPFKWSVCPVLRIKESKVLANMTSESLRKDLINSSFSNVAKNINTIPIGMVYSNFEDYLVREDNNKLTVLTRKKSGWINCKKTSNEVGTKYGGVYIRIDYESLDDLDGDILINYTHNSGKEITQNCILFNVTDWGNPSNQGSTRFKLNTVFNLKELLLNSGHDYASKKHLYICIVQYNVNGVSETYDYDFRVVFSPKKCENVRATMLSQELNDELDSKYVNLNTYKPYITCWCDSLTAGGGWTHTLESILKVPVLNGGTGGENSLTIMARQGADVMITNNIIIPPTKTPVTIARRHEDQGISTQLGKKVTPLLQGGTHHVNPCYIDDIEGTLTWTGSSYSDPNGIWTFTRNSEGEQVTINRPTAIRTHFDINKNAPKLMIIYIGQNGGWDNDVNELIRQHKLMIDHAKAEDYIILGFSSGSSSERKVYEDTMKKEFGRRFISLREYLSQYGLEDAGLSATEEDTIMIAEGKTPKSLLADTVHYNDKCKTVIGKMLAKRIRELNII